jgi:hypothetical protein
MDGTATTLQEKLDDLLHQAAEASLALDRANGTIVGIPHYSVIETRAHELGQQLSRLIQARQMSQLAGHAADFAPCPECGTRCQLERKGRRIASIDGSFTVEEPSGYCPRCRRGFFPLPSHVGPRRP